MGLWAGTFVSVMGANDVNPFGKSNRSYSKSPFYSSGKSRSYHAKKRSKASWVELLNGWCGITAVPWDEVTSGVRPIMHTSLVGVGVILLFIGVSSFVLFNLVTAIVVEQAFSAVSADKELLVSMKRSSEQEAVEALKMLFEELDEDGSGELSSQEFTDVLDDPKFIRRLAMLDLDVSELPELFTLFDTGDGMVQGEIRSKDMYNCVVYAKTLSEVVEVCGTEQLEDRVYLPMLECTDVHIPELMVQMDDAFTDLTVMTQCVKVGGVREKRAAIVSSVGKYIHMVN
ncbi:hypothetical protein Pmar_PMAR014864 [Perkinsus marinus ATCC 50983]|uniref:EF-hand domain-containing protein n=1 Tax=Perkinsus marinus (strain ATCC 50983 / TXsc) TaxID=423536 RepID=C5L541_PERM5|nr:hypothetical protein Pmar_PMAR014864 [Perkinsus marinus ATCC 50983]EER08100.1 hypothetical protein Pmar_PMAR014864 [Perkinsus marinus ATCC 50983]|eukprot:XP_002776284.1 hypothetical protein Pmar_PMAR014864 [Perkinsus marinus ATCC 50983]